MSIVKSAFWLCACAIKAASAGSFFFLAFVVSPSWSTIISTSSKDFFSTLQNQPLSLVCKADGLVPVVVMPGLCYQQQGRTLSGFIAQGLSELNCPLRPGTTQDVAVSHERPA